MAFFVANGTATSTRQCFFLLFFQISRKRLRTFHSFVASRIHRSLDAFVCTRHALVEFNLCPRARKLDLTHPDCPRLYLENCVRNANDTGWFCENFARVHLANQFFPRHEFPRDLLTFGRSKYLSKLLKFLEVLGNLRIFRRPFKN